MAGGELFPPLREIAPVMPGIRSVVLLAMCLGTAAHAEPPAMVTGLTGDDYPSWAVRKNVGGRVVVELTIDETGAVKACTVLGSSGHGTLDRDTCSLLTAKARFAPSPAPGERTFLQATFWRLSDMDAYDPLETYGLRFSRIRAGWDLFMPAPAAAGLSCAEAGDVRICEIPASNPETFRQDVPSAGKLTAIIRARDGELIGLRLETASRTREEYVAGARSEWGQPCFHDEEAGLTGWIAGYAYVVLRPDSVTISGRGLDSATERVAASCPGFARDMGTVADLEAQRARMR